MRGIRILSSSGGNATAERKRQLMSLQGYIPGFTFKRFVSGRPSQFIVEIDGYDEELVLIRSQVEVFVAVMRMGYELGTGTALPGGLALAASQRFPAS